MGRVLMLMTIGLAMGAADDTPSELKKLEGIWTISDVEIEGHAVPVEAIQQRKETLTFKGDKVTMADARTTHPSSDFTIDPTKTPKTLDLNGPNNDVTKKRAFIYDLQGNTLKLCQFKDGVERPKEFKSSETVKTILITLKRQAP